MMEWCERSLDSISLLSNLGEGRWAHFRVVPIQACLSEVQVRVWATVSESPIGVCYWSFPTEPWVQGFPGGRYESSTFISKRLHAFISVLSLLRVGKSIFGKDLGVFVRSHLPPTPVWSTTRMVNMWLDLWLLCKKGRIFKCMRLGWNLEALE